MGLFRRTQDASTEVDPKQAQRLVVEESAVLLDVREPAEWVAGHAPEALHVPLGELDLDRVPRDRIVVAVCRAGGRSGMAVRHLRAAGIDARNLAGGMGAWKSAGLPVVRDDGSEGVVA